MIQTKKQFARIFILFVFCNKRKFSARVIAHKILLAIIDFGRLNTTMNEIYQHSNIKAVVSELKHNF